MVPWREARGPILAALSSRKALHGHAASSASVPVWARMGLAHRLVEIGSTPCWSGHPAILIDGYECRHVREPEWTSDWDRRRISGQKHQNSQLCWVPVPEKGRRWYQCDGSSPEVDLFLNAPKSKGISACLLVIHSRMNETRPISRQGIMKFQREKVPK